jgi:hypothetical protein
MPATSAAFEVNARQADHKLEQDFSAVILQMEKQDHLRSVANELGQERRRFVSEVDRVG